jgi:hypothetical protein
MIDRVMSDVVAAAFLALVVAWGAHKFASGELSFAFGDSAPPLPRGVADEQKAGQKSSEDAIDPYPKIFGAWATKALAEFAALERDVAGDGATRGGLRMLYAARSAIMENFYARQRFAPNDDKLVSDMEREAKNADLYMTSAINRLRSGNADLRFVRFPMSCGDGDARFPVKS